MTLPSPHFFGPRGRERFGMVSWPSGAVRGAALLCPPFGYEQVCAYPTLRQLAAELAEQGIVTLRFDYDGTGNSLGNPTDPDRVASWQASVRDAVAELRAFGLGPLVVVGLRLGAALATSAGLSPDEVAGLVLWQPIVSGRRYGRGMQLLSIGEPVEIDGHTVRSIAGFEIDDATLQGMRRLQLQADELPVPTLVLTDPDPSQEEVESSRQIERCELTGTAAMLGTDAELAEVPTGTVQAIAGWVVRHAVAPGATPAPPTFRQEAIEAVDGTPIVHRLLRVRPGELFAVETALEGAHRRAVVLSNNGVAPQVGPGRSWVGLAKLLALEGYRVLRLDVSGIGESPPRPGFAEHECYPAWGGQDIADAVDLMVQRGADDAALVGLCSGALLSFDALAASDRVAAVVGVNGRFDRPYADPRRVRRRRLADRTILPLAIPLTKSKLFPLFDRIPRPLWEAMFKLHLVGSPTRMVERAVALGVSVMLMFGPDEWGWRAMWRRRPRATEALVAGADLHVVELSALDHSMFDLHARQQVTGMIVDHLVRTVPPHPPHPTSEGLDP